MPKKIAQKFSLLKKNAIKNVAQIFGDLPEFYFFETGRPPLLANTPTSHMQPSKEPHMAREP